MSNGAFAAIAICCFIGMMCLMFACINTSAKLEARIAEHKKDIKDYNELVKQHNQLVMAYKSLQMHLNNGTRPGPSQLTKDELKALLSLCHPDKHGGSKLSTRMTQRLLELR